MASAALNYIVPAYIACHVVVPNAPTDLNIINTGIVHTRILPNGYVAYPDIGVAYKVYDENISWTQARKRCLLEGAQLALIDSVKKLEYVTQQRRSKVLAHVGIHSMFDDDEWVRVSDGRAVQSMPWADGEPNHGWKCALVEFENGGLGNYGCSDHNANYVCELPIH